MKNRDQRLLEEAYNSIQQREIEKEADAYDRKQFYKDKGVYKDKNVEEFLKRTEDGYDALMQEVLGSYSWSNILDHFVNELRLVDLTIEQKDAIIAFYKDLNYESWFYEDLLDAVLFSKNFSYQDYLKYLEDNFSKFRDLRNKLPELEGLI